MGEQFSSIVPSTYVEKIKLLMNKALNGLPMEAAKQVASPKAPVKEAS